MGYARRVDVNQDEIVQDLRRMGAFVQTLHRQGQGCPDLLVAWRQRWYLFEVKRDAKSKLTQDEKDWYESVAGRGPVYVITSAMQALNVMQEAA